MSNKLKNAIAISLGAAGAGAGLMFLFDPNRGGRRRGFIGDKTVHVAKFVSRGFRKSGKDLSNRTRGVVAETSARVAREGVADDILAERVRSKLGRVLSHPRAIDVMAQKRVERPLFTPPETWSKKVTVAANSGTPVQFVISDNK